MNIAEFSIRKNVITLISAFLMVLLGIQAFNKMSRLEDPEFTIKTAVISTSYPGATAEEVEQEVVGVGADHARRRLVSDREIEVGRGRRRGARGFRGHGALRRVQGVPDDRAHVSRDPPGTLLVARAALLRRGRGQLSGSMQRSAVDGRRAVCDRSFAAGGRTTRGRRED